MDQKRASMIVRIVATVLLTGMYIRLLYMEREIPRMVEGLRVVAIGIALIGTEPVIEILSRYLKKGKE